MAENLTGALLFLAGIYGPIYALVKYSEHRQKKEKQTAAELKRSLDAQMNLKMEQHYTPPDWKYRRQYVLARDNYKCTKCGSSSSPHVHHVIPRKVKIDHSAKNLVTLCNLCHGAEHSTTFESNETKSIKRRLNILSRDGRQVQARISHCCDGCESEIRKGESYILITRGTINFSIMKLYPGGAKLCAKCAK